MITNRGIPPELETRPFFTVAEAVELGVSRRTLARLPRPHRGVLGLHLPTTVLEDAQALSLVLPPGCIYSHLTAAWLLGLPVPWRWSGRERTHLDVACYGRTPPRRERVDGHRLNRPDLPTVMLPGLSVPVLDPPHVFRQLAPRLSPTERVVLGDLVVGWRTGRTSEDLAAAMSVRSPGVRAAREALLHVVPGVNSAMESRLRQDFVGRGIPAPALNAPVVDEFGEPFAYADFLWERYKLVVEYNGDHHFRTPEQRLADEARRNRLERLGYRVIVINRVDYFQHWERTMQAVERALGEQARSLGVAA